MRLKYREFAPPPTSKETSRHASRHVRDTRAVIYVGIAGIPGAWGTRNFTYLARGPWDVLSGGHVVIDMHYSTGKVYHGPFFCKLIVRITKHIITIS